MSKKEVLIFVFLLCLVVSCFVFGATHDPWDGTKWDVASPDIDQPHGNDYKEIYDLRKGVAVRMNKEHETLATSSAGGVHKQGSARAFFQDAAPTTQVDGSAFDSGDLGLIWFDSNAAIDNQFHVLTATTPTWTPISTEIIAFLLASNRTFAGTLTVTGLLTANSGVTLGAGDDLIGSSTSDITFNTNKFTVAGATGNTVMAGTASVGGTLDVTGNIDPTTYETTNGGFLNSDTMASAADNGVASSDSIVKYATLDADGVLMHDATGGFSNADVDGTKTKVYTKYFTGTTDADSQTDVAHSIAGAPDKILSIVAYTYNSNESVYITNENYRVASANDTFDVRADATNISLANVGSYCQGQKYRIRIDYIL